MHPDDFDRVLDVFELLADDPDEGCALQSYTFTETCPWCDREVTIAHGPDPFVGSVWSGLCPCGADYSAGPDTSPRFGNWSPPDPARDIDEGDES